MTVFAYFKREHNPPFLLNRAVLGCDLARARHYRFQSPCGDYVSGKLSLANKATNHLGFSPLAGIMLAESWHTLVKHLHIHVFQSPCGDYVSGKLTRHC